MRRQKIHTAAHHGRAYGETGVVEDHEGRVSAGEICTRKARPEMGKTDGVERPDQPAPDEKRRIKGPPVTRCERDCNCAQGSSKAGCEQYETAVESVGQKAD